jgi:hypothetical protein
MRDDHLKQITQIMGDMHCPKKFRCAESGFEDLCKAKDGGLENYLDCLEKNSSSCLFALSFGYGHFCQCPLRIYLCKKMQK